MSQLVLCHIYRSSRKADTYLYVAEKDDFSVVPEALLKAFGDPEFSFSLELTADRKLAKEDARQVLSNLEENGYHLQMADDLLIEQQLALKSLN
jgi:hypothetical protein